MSENSESKGPRLINRRSSAHDFMEKNGACYQATFRVHTSVALNKLKYVSDLLSSMEVANAQQISLAPLKSMLLSEEGYSPLYAVVKIIDDHVQKKGVYYYEVHLYDDVVLPPYQPYDRIAQYHVEVQVPSGQYQHDLCLSQQWDNWPKDIVKQIKREVCLADYHSHMVKGVSEDGILTLFVRGYSTY